MSKKSNIDEFFKMKPKYADLAGLSWFFLNNSASRLNMFAQSHMPKSLALINGREPYLASSEEFALSESVDDIKVLKGGTVIDIIALAGHTDDLTERIYIIQTDDNELTHVILKSHGGYHYQFGYRYRINEDIVKNIGVGSYIPADTVLATPMNMGTNGGVKRGAYLNVLHAPYLETNEDAVILSETAVKRLSFLLLDKGREMIRQDRIPLNIYGDENEYKIFPNVGEYVNDIGLLMAFRDVIPGLSPGLMSNKQLREFDPIHDTGVFNTRPNGRVVKLDVTLTTPNKYVYYDKPLEQLTKKWNSKKWYYERIVSNVEQYEQKMRSMGKTPNVSPELHTLYLEAKSMISDNIKIKEKNTPLNAFIVDYIVEHVIEPYIGYKITGSNGDKSIISIVVQPDEEMPYDKNGRRADLIVSMDSKISRMNIGQPYEMGINEAIAGTLRKVREALEKELERQDIVNFQDLELNDTVMGVYEYLMGMHKLINEDEYNFRRSMETPHTIRERLESAYNDTYQIAIISAEINAMEIMNKLNNSPYKPFKDKIYVLNKITGQWEETIEDFYITPYYVVMLDSMPSSWLAVGSALINQYKLVAAPTRANKTRYQYNKNPPRFSDADVRILSSYTIPEASVMVRESATSLKVHEHIYKTIMTHDNPMAIDSIREDIPYGSDSILEYTMAQLATMGSSFEYTPEDGDKQ